MSEIIKVKPKSVGNLKGQEGFSAECDLKVKGSEVLNPVHITPLFSFSLGRVHPRRTFVRVLACTFQKDSCSK